MGRVCMRTEQQLSPSSRCCCLQRPLVSMWNCTDLSHLLLPWYLLTFISQSVQLFLLTSPETCLVFALPSPAPGFSLLELFHISCFSDVLSHLWHASAIYLRKEMHPEQFIDSLFCLPTCSCIEEASCPRSKILVHRWSLSEAVQSGHSGEGSFTITPCVLWGLPDLHHDVDEGGAQSLSCFEEFSRFNPCLMHHQLNNLK